MSFNESVLDHAVKVWDAEIIPALQDYIRIPNVSKSFDADWKANGFMDQAVELVRSWCAARQIAGLQVTVEQLEGLTPLIVVDVPAFGEGTKLDLDDTILLYGHLDKQPEMSGWSDGLGPWQPVIRGDKLFGRGGADDGYAIFGSLAAIMALREQKLAHARCVILIEACEESGSYDLPYYVDHLADRIGKPSLVVCLDSGCGNYDQLWCTTSLRGLAGGNLIVNVLSEGVHSGDASGIVPSSFRILRQLLSRLEDEASGKIKIDGLFAPIPEDRLVQARKVAEVMGTAVYDKFPFLPGMTPMSADLTELVLNRTWRPALSITGADGLPPLDNAGNVLRPSTAVKLSLRLPPTLDGEVAGAILQKLLLDNPPNGANVSFHLEKSSTGWNAPPLSDWLNHAIDHASQDFFGRPAVFMGEGGTIPFMGMLGEKFPGAQFMITGVLGPHSNAHGPNEFLHIPTGKRVTACVARVLAEHHAASVQGLTTGVGVAAGDTRFGDHGCC